MFWHSWLKQASSIISCQNYYSATPVKQDKNWLLLCLLLHLLFASDASELLSSNASIWVQVQSASRSLVCACVFV